MTARLELPTLDPVMLAIAVDPCRHRACSISRQRGKGYLGLTVGTDRAWRGGTCWFLSPTFAQADGMFRRELRLLASVSVVDVSESRRELRFPSGGTLTFKSADQRENLRGATLDMIVGDEWAYADPDGELWNTIAPMLSVRRGRFVGLSTPRGVGDAWHRMVMRGDPTRADRDPEWRSWSIGSVGSPYITAAELEAVRRTMPELDFRREYLAEFVSTAGARIKREWIVRDTPPDGLSLAMGVDLSASMKSQGDWNAAVVMGRDAAGMTYVVDAQRMRGSMGDIIEWIKSLAVRHSPDVIAIESLFFQRWIADGLMRDTSLPIVPTRPTVDKIQRAIPFEVRLANDLVRIGPDVPEAFVDECLAWPAGEHDDQIDAAAYAFASLDDVGDPIDTTPRLLHPRWDNDVWGPGNMGSDFGRIR